MQSKPSSSKHCYFGFHNHSYDENHTAITLDHLLYTICYYICSIQFQRIVFYLLTDFHKNECILPSIYFHKSGLFPQIMQIVISPNCFFTTLAWCKLFFTVHIACCFDLLIFWICYRTCGSYYCFFIVDVTIFFHIENPELFACLSWSTSLQCHVFILLNLDLVLLTFLCSSIPYLLTLPVLKVQVFL